MIVCPNCNHQNPDGANQCEACYTPLPTLMACPSCGNAVQANASFCGQCGADLRENASPAATVSSASPDELESASAPDSTIKTQNFLNLDTPQSPTGDPAIASASTPNNSTDFELPDFDLPELVEPDPLVAPEPVSNKPEAEPLPEPASEPLSPPSAPVATPAVTPAATPAVTQLQTISVRLRHVQTDTPIELPKQLSTIRIGKPNDRTPPDIDVSGFPDSEIVSRTHAKLLVEGDVYYIEDVGSSNGTYVNGLPLPTGNRHRLRPGDRVALGKGDKVSFIFEAAS